MKNYFIFVMLMFSMTLIFAETLFFENFENDLSAWYGQGGGSYSAAIVNDPLETDHAVNFNQLIGGGDIFTQNEFLSSNGQYILSFDYLGLAQDNSHGYIGYSQGTPGNHSWLSGNYILPSDGQWHHMIFEFTVGENTTTINNVVHNVNIYNDVPNINAPIRIMIEDFTGNTGDALFDNILLTDSDGATGIPEPGSLLSFAITLFLLKIFYCKFQK